MFLEDVSVKHFAVAVAALGYFILGAIWYSPAVFGHRSMRHEPGSNDYPRKTPIILAYIGELIISFILAYILALFIEITQAREILEGVAVALWIWLGFIATTHFSAVLWARKTLRSFFIHAGFMLFGFLLMGILLPALR